MSKSLMMLYFGLNLMVMMMIVEFITPQVDYGMANGLEGYTGNAVTGYRYGQNPVHLKAALEKELKEASKCPKKCPAVKKDIECPEGTIVYEGKTDECGCEIAPKCDVTNNQCTTPPIPSQCYNTPGKIDGGTKKCAYDKKPCPEQAKRQPGWCNGKIIEMTDKCGCPGRAQCNAKTSKFD